MSSTNYFLKYFVAIIPFLNPMKGKGVRIMPSFKGVFRNVENLVSK